MIPHGVQIFVSLEAIDLRYSFDRTSGRISRSIGGPMGWGVPDHQRVAVVTIDDEPQKLWPQCFGCGREQGLTVGQALEALSRRVSE